MTQDVLDTATGQLVYQLTAIIISAVVTIVGVYVKKFLKTNAFVKEYDLYNAKVERTLKNAIMYAEARAKNYAKEKISKKDLAMKYIDMIDPEIVAKEGNKLEFMIDRKVKQVLKK